jgi:hypothetical protein
MHNRDGRHSLAPFKQADVVSMQFRVLRKSFLGEASGKSPAPEDFAKSLLEWMHGLTTKTEINQCNPSSPADLHTFVWHTIVC